jgi:F-type H+-transporting ATPase subunit a
MASAILHIKDSYYFEVPKYLWRSTRESLADFPNVWVRLDPDYLRWEAERIHDALAESGVAGLPARDALVESYVEWKHADHANAGRPLTAYLERQSPEWFERAMEQPSFAQAFNAIQRQVGSAEWVSEYRGDPAHVWSQEKIDLYNVRLSGKVLIPQPFGELRNLYEAKSGFAISRFMVLEVAVAIVVTAVFVWLAGRMRSGERPRGRMWNLLETILLFLRDEVARPAIGKHEADKFVPLLWTIFLFVLGCNLAGMVPWAGTPTSDWSVTLTLAAVTFGTVIVFGSLKFGWLGFWLNQVPSMDLPGPMALFIKPAIFAIEVIGLFIKHAVLSIRLLANMVAGHMVLVSILFLAFSHEAVEQLSSSTWLWGGTAVAAVVGSALLSLLELFVAFLQAYIFTFLSALFIGAAVHHH